MNEKQKRKFSSEFKAKVAIEAIKEQLTIEEICKKYDLHPTQVNNWKKAFKENASIIFDTENKSKPEKTDDLIQQLYAQIGELKVANDWLKKNFHDSHRTSQSNGRTRKQYDKHSFTMRFIEYS